MSFIEGLRFAYIVARRMKPKGTTRNIVVIAIGSWLIARKEEKAMENNTPFKEDDIVCLKGDETKKKMWVDLIVGERVRVKYFDSKGDIKVDDFPYQQLEIWEDND